MYKRLKMFTNNDATVRVGDFIKIQPLDPYFAMMISEMMMVETIINDMTIVTAGGNIIDLSTFRIIYVNGRDYDKYTMEDIFEASLKDLRGVTKYSGEDDGHETTT